MTPSTREIEDSSSRYTIPVKVKNTHVEQLATSLCPKVKRYLAATRLIFHGCVI